MLCATPECFVRRSFIMAIRVQWVPPVCDDCARFFRTHMCLRANTLRAPRVKRRKALSRESGDALEEQRIGSFARDRMHPRTGNYEINLAPCQRQFALFRLLDGARQMFVLRLG